MGAARNAVLATSIAAMLAAAPVARADAKTCIAQSEQAQQARSNGALRDARDLFEACAAAECPAAIRRDCERSFDEVDHAVPTIVLIVRRGGRDVTDVHVLVDGLLVAQKLDGRPLALDPGPHHIRVESPSGARLGEQDIVAHEAEKNRLLPIDVARPLVVEARGPVGPTDGAPPPDVRQHTAWPWIVMGVGLAAVGVGVALVAVGQSDIAASRAGCTIEGDGNLACPAPYTADGRDRASLNAAGTMMSNGGVVTAIAGGVVLLGGVVWHFVEPTGPRRHVAFTPMLGPGIAGGTLAWAF